MHLERYFCEAAKSTEIPRDHVFIAINEGWETLADKYPDFSVPRPWEYYQDYKSIVLLGPPRQGKTMEFLHQRGKANKGFYLPLRNISTMGSLDESFSGAIDDREQWKVWLANDEPGELFIDALDEGKLTTANMIRNIITWLNNLDGSNISRLRIHLSCRNADWNCLDNESWFKFFSHPTNTHTLGHEVPGVVVLELLDLSREEYQKYCHKHGVDPTAILQGVPIRARQFLARPITLAMVVEEHKQTGKIPDNVRELYDHAILRRLAESNRHYQQYLRNYPDTGRRKIAEFYAFLTIFSGRDIISSSQVDPYAHVPSQLGIFESKQELITFNSALFRSEIFQQYRFDDPELAEYLAASQLDNYINSNSITAKRAFNLFLSEYDQKEPVPRLKGTMIWLCALNDEIRKLALDLNPGLLLFDFPGELLSADKLMVWDWLKTHYAGRKYFDYDLWGSGAKALACPEIAPELKEALENPTMYGRDLRIMALQIAEEGKLNSLGETIEKVVSDLNEDDILLPYAAETLATIAPDRVSVLKKWLYLKPEQDPENSLLGVALEILWPNHITVEQLADSLRPQIKDSIGRYFMFLYRLHDGLTDDQRAVVIKKLIGELELILAAHKNQSPYNGSIWPSEFILNFLIRQIEGWKNEQSRVPELEQWVAIAIKAREMGLIREYETEKAFDEILVKDHKLRQQISIQALERLYEEDYDNFTSQQRISWVNGFPPKKQDLCFWVNELIKFDKHDPLFIEAIWWNVIRAWEHADYRPNIWNKFSYLVENNDTISSLWDKWHVAFLPTEDDYWQRKRAIQRRESEQRIEFERATIKNNLYNIADGDLNLLHRLSAKDEDEITKEYGTEVTQAYLKGLFKLWQNFIMPPLSDYYPKHYLRNSRILSLAIEKWYQSPSTDWSCATVKMRSTALQIGIGELNKLPAWYQSLVEIEQEQFKNIALEALELENKLGDRYPGLANRLKHHNDFQIYVELAFEFLKNNPSCNSELAIALAKTIANDTPDKHVKDFLEELGKDRLQIGEAWTGLTFLSAAWRYQPHQIWDWLNEHFFTGLDTQRKEQFKEWINALHSFYSGTTDEWPSWVQVDALIELMPDFWVYFPADEDPTTEEFNSGDRAIQRRDRLGRFRKNALNKVVASGLPAARELIENMLCQPKFSGSFDSLKMYLDAWPKYQAAQTWMPLTPNELLDVVAKGKRPVRTHSEFFELVTEMIEDIKLDFQSGQFNLKSLFWDKDKTPCQEQKIQSLCADKFANHPLRSKILGNREVAVTDENKPDIKLETVLENGDKAIIYVEIKRQMHTEIFSAIRTQLADKYLIVPEAKYGVYFVAWFGPHPQYWKVSQREIRTICGERLNSANDLEKCLQSLADIIIAKRNDIEGVKVIVADVSNQ